MWWPVKLPVARAPRDSNVTSDQALAVPALPPSLRGGAGGAKHKPGRSMLVLVASLLLSLIQREPKSQWTEGVLAKP